MSQSSVTMSVGDIKCLPRPPAAIGSGLGDFGLCWSHLCWLRKHHPRPSVATRWGIRDQTHQSGFADTKGKGIHGVWLGSGRYYPKGLYPAWLPHSKGQTVDFSWGFFSCVFVGGSRLRVSLVSSPGYMGDFKKTQGTDCHAIPHVLRSYSVCFPLHTFQSAPSLMLCPGFLVVCSKEQGRINLSHLVSQLCFTMFHLYLHQIFLGQWNTTQDQRP